MARVLCPERVYSKVDVELRPKVMAQSTLQAVNVNLFRPVFVFVIRRVLLSRRLAGTSAPY